MYVLHDCDAGGIYKRFGAFLARGGRKHAQDRKMPVTRPKTRRMRGAFQPMIEGTSRWFRTIARSAEHSLAVALAAGILAALPTADTGKSPRSSVYQSTILPILEDHCYECHGDGYDKGKVAFDRLETDDQILKPDLWLRVLLNTRAGLMPAERKPRLPAAEQQTLERWIKYDVFGIDPQNPDPGRVTVRRLNRVEYRNTVHDLLGVDYNTDHEFPPDDSGFGFDNIGDALTMSPMLMEKYVAAAQAVIAEAVPTAAAQARRSKWCQGIAFDGTNARSKWGKRQLVFNEPANVSRQILHSELPGTYRVKLEIEVNGSYVPDPGRARVIFKVDGKEFLEPGIRLLRREGVHLRVHAQVERRAITCSPSNCSPRCRRRRKKPSSTCS